MIIRILKQKKIITFSIINGISYNILINTILYKITPISDLIHNYFLAELEHPIDLSQIKFFYKGKLFNSSNDSMLNEFFKDENNPIVDVEDVNKLIGKSINIIFQTNHGDKRTLIKNSKWTIEKLLGFYLYEMFPNLLIGKNKIEFFYNNKQIKPGNASILEEFFENESNPIINVNDKDNILLIKRENEITVTFKTTGGGIKTLK